MNDENISHNLFLSGEIVASFEPHDVEQFEKLVQEVAKQSGKIVNWHYIGKRAVVLAFPENVAMVRPLIDSVIRPVLEKRHQEFCDELLKKVIDDANKCQEDMRVRLLEIAKQYPPIDE